MARFPGLVRGAGSSAVRDASWFAWSRGRWKTKAMFYGPPRVRPVHPRRTSGPFLASVCPRFLARPLFLPFHGLFRRLRIRIEAFLQEADCLANRVDVSDKSPE